MSPLDIVNDLLARAKEGDEAAKEEIFQVLFERFKFLAKRTIQTEEEAEDVAQEACITVLEKYESETFTVSFGAWAGGILRKKIGNYLQGREVRRRRLIPESESRKQEHVAEGSEIPDLEQKLLACFKKIRRINRRYARVINLAHQGYRIDEISGRLGCNRNTLCILLSRGRSMLKRCLNTGVVK